MNWFVGDYFSTFLTRMFFSSLIFSMIFLCRLTVIGNIRNNPVAAGTDIIGVLIGFYVLSAVGIMDVQKSVTACFRLPFLTSCPLSLYFGSVLLSGHDLCRDIQLNICTMTP